MNRFGLPFAEYPVLENEPARAWLFTFILTPPTAVMGGNAADGAHLQLVARTAELPQMSIGESTDYFVNQTMYHSAKHSPETLSASFLISMNPKNAVKILYDWCNLISNWTDTFTTGYARDFKTDIRVKVWEHKGLVPIITYVLVRAWPQGLPKVSLDYNSGDPLKFDVTWRFDRFYIENA